MKTLTVTKARGQLGDLLWRAIQGEDIALVHSGSGKIVALRPVEVYSEDYALVEYGLTSAEMKRAEKKVLREVAAERKAGQLTEWKP